MKLKNWSIETYGGSYDAPELFETRLVGEVYGHSNPRHYDGKRVVTSQVMKVEGRKVTTHSGSVYTLGNVLPGYRNFLKREDPDWDWRNPLKVNK